MNPKALIRLLLETSGHADQNVAKFLARDTDALMDAMRQGKVDDLLRGSNEGRALMNNPEFMRMTAKVGGNLDYITRAGQNLAAGRNVNAAEFLTKMDIPANSSVANTLTKSITDFNGIAARGAQTASNNADTIAAARRARAPRDLNADEVAERLNQAKKPAPEAAANAAPNAGAAKPGVHAAEEAAEAASKTTGTLSRREITRIMDSNASTADKLGIFARSGHTEMFDRVLIQARRHGLKEGDNTVIQNSKLPDAIKARVQEISDIQLKGGMAARMDSFKATFSREGISDMASQAAAHPFKTGYDVFAAQWRIPMAGLRLAKEHKLAAAGIIAAGSGADIATDGASTRALGSGLRTVGSGYIAADTALINGGLALGGAAIGLASSKPAEVVLDSAGNAAAQTAGNAPGMLTRLFSSATGADQGTVDQTVSSVLDNPVVAFFAPGALKNTLHAKKANDLLHANGDPSAPNTGDIALATADSKPPSAADRLAAGAAGARDSAEDALAGMNIGAMMKDPAQAMVALRGFAKDNPTMQKALDIAEQNPMLKWGLIGGFALGAAGDARSAGQRVANGLKSAMIIGVLMDLMGGLFGKPSLIMSMVRGTMNPQTTLQNPTGAVVAPTPTPDAGPNAAPTTAPATALATAPAATATAAAPAPLRGNFAEKSAPPALVDQPDPSTTSFAFNNATLNKSTPVAPVGGPTPAANDRNYNQSIYMPSSM